jgi:Helix-turn-helix domain
MGRRRGGEATEAEGEWLGTPEVGRRLGLTPGAVWHHISRGRLKARRIGGRYRMRTEDVEAFRLWRARESALRGRTDGRLPAGAPRGSLNAIKDGHASLRLGPVLRELAPRTRQAVQTTVAVEALRRASFAPNPRERNRARITAAIDVLDAYREAVRVAPRHELDRHVRVLRAMAPFLRPSRLHDQARLVEGALARARGSDGPQACREGLGRRGYGRFEP